MSWIILEGVDRVAKSSIANHYKSLGYEYHHFNAPDKKYNDPSYLGPSYFDDVLTLYTEFSGRNVVFDRSIWGEMVWPYVYKRRPQLLEADFIYLKDIERDNATQHILLVDSNRDAHWGRCVANNEPLTREQFDRAYTLYERLALAQSFEIKDSAAFYKELTSKTLGEKAETTLAPEKIKTADIKESKKEVGPTTQLLFNPEDPIKKLEEANAINEILAGRILKKKGDVFERLEGEIRSFLDSKLRKILGTGAQSDLSNEEIQILKVFVQRIKDKENK